MRPKPHALGAWSESFGFAYEFAGSFARNPGACAVIPSKDGVQKIWKILDSGFRRNDGGSCQRGASGLFQPQSHLRSRTKAARPLLADLYLCQFAF
jgi:hypothetical protein